MSFLRHVKVEAPILEVLALQSHFPAALWSHTTNHAHTVQHSLHFPFMVHFSDLSLSESYFNASEKKDP